MEIIHSIFGVMKRTSKSCHLNTDTAATNNTTFLPKVCQLVNIRRIPKNKKTPTLNSMADNAIPTSKGA